MEELQSGCNYSSNTFLASNMNCNSPSSREPYVLLMNDSPFQTVETSDQQTVTTTSESAHPLKKQDEECLFHTPVLHDTTKETLFELETPIVHSMSASSFTLASSNRGDDINFGTDYLRRRYLSMLGNELLLNWGYVPNFAPLIDNKYEDQRSRLLLRASTASRGATPVLGRIPPEPRRMDALSTPPAPPLPPSSPCYSWSQSPTFEPNMDRRHSQGLEPTESTEEVQHRVPGDSGSLGRHRHQSTVTTRRFLMPGSMKSSIFNLTSATMGAGALSLPYAISKTGLVFGFLLLAAVGYLSYLATRFIIHTVNYTGLKTFEEMAVAAGGRRFAIFVEVSIILFSFGTAVGYLICVGDIAHALLSSFSAAIWAPDAATLPTLGSWIVSTSAWTVLNRVILSREFALGMLTLVILLPLCLFERLGELRVASFLGVSAIGLLVLVVAFELFSRNQAMVALQSVMLPQSLMRVVQVTPIIIFAFTCQSNVPAIYCELENQNYRRMVKVASRSALLCFAIYLGMGVFGFLSWGAATSPNILTNYNSHIVDEIPVAVAFTGMALAVAIAYPMNIFPCRFSLEMLLFLNRPDMRVTRRTQTLIATLVVALTLMCALFVPSVSSVFEIVGSTAGALVAFIFPGFFFVKLLPGSAWHYRKLKACGLIFVGSVVAVFGTVCSVRNVLISYS